MDGVYQWTDLSAQQFLHDDAGESWRNRTRVNTRVKGSDEGLRVAESKKYALLNVTETIVAVGNRGLCEIATGTWNPGILYVTIVNQTGKKHRGRFSSLIVSGLGHNAFSPSIALNGRIVNLLERGIPGIEMGRKVGFDSVRN